MKPTEKQLFFINRICEILNIDNPNCQTKEEASEWISDNVEEYNEYIEDMSDCEGMFACGIYDSD